ncbi:unnamed protein product [Clavelina lepadiformis]|uniref:Acylglycerol kinase, mitochondrial n=1 Tax=Clavelina lepadiformis TaxID=159417 RepID=A0ABP0FEI7_CLALP
MLLFCSVTHHGTDPVHWLYEPKTITVFLNPAANNGKASKLFEKNAAPILQLSGCHINVVRLEYEGQAKQLMSVLEKSDMIVAAGGNGTVSEVITGLMRRPDFKTWLNVPIGVIPLGKTNTLCRKLCTECDPSNTAQWIMTATSDILKSTCRPVDVMKVTADTGKSVYAVSDIRWGSYSEAQGKTDKYWYWGPLKKYMTFVFASFRSKIQTPRELELSYNGPKPVVVPAKETKPVSTPDNINNSILGSKIVGFFNWIWSKSNDAEVNASEKQLSNDNNKEDDGESQVVYGTSGKNYKTLEFVASANVHDPNKGRASACAQITIEKPDFTMLQFITNGPNYFKNNEPNSDQLTKISSSQFEITPANPDEVWFKIDNEDYEAMTCKVELFPNIIKMICSNISTQL